MCVTIPSMAEPAITVIVPAHNAAETITSTLQGLQRQDAEFEWEVLVIDDGSTDGTASVAAQIPGTRVISQSQRGAGSARNRGVEAARADVLAFTDADCVPSPAWLRKGIAAISDADLVQGSVRPDPSAARRPFDRTVWVDGRGALYETANLMVRRVTFERVGGSRTGSGKLKEGLSEKMCGSDGGCGVQAREWRIATTQSCITQCFGGVPWSTRLSECA